MQADLMTISSIGCHPLSVVTALTVQDTVGVVGIMAVDGAWVEDQARTLLEDMPVAAFKIGLLGSIDNIVVIAGILADYPGVPLVLDPVLASGRGDELADEEMIAGLRDLLLPLTTILTPNTLEVADWLSAKNVLVKANMTRPARLPGRMCADLAGPGLRVCAADRHA